MATSAKKEITCGQNNHYHLYLTITVNKQDVANNKTNVTVKMYAKSDSSNYHAYNLDDSANTAKLTVDGSSKVNKKMAMDFRNKATVNMASWTGDISHDADGKKKLTCSGSFTISGTSSLSGANISCDIQLDDIARATKPGLSAATIELGKAVTVKIAGAVSTWTHDLYYRIGSGSWNKVTTGLKADYSWTVPKTIANSFPNAESGTITIGLNTMNGKTKIGSTQVTDLKITVPSTFKPSVSDISVVEGVKDLELFGAGFIQNKTKISFSVTAAGSYGSTIKSYKYMVGSQSYTSTEKNYKMTDVVKSSGTVAVKVEVTDSRGRTGQKSIQVEVAAYKAPQITAFSCERCGSDGATDNNGQYAKLTVKFEIAPLNEDNSKSYALEYRESGTDSWNALTNGSVYSYNGTYITEAVFDAANAYEVRLTIKDAFSTADITQTIGTAVKLISYIRKKAAIAIGKIAKIADTVEIALKTIFQKKVTFNDDVVINGQVTLKQNVLWSGTVWPTADQTATFSGKVSEQTNGIVLVWSRYVDGEGAKDDQFVSCFVPKKLVAQKEGKGHTFTLFANSFSNVSSKYVYISNNRLTGHVNNTETGTGTIGLKYNNKYFALRYVIGV